MPRLIIFLVLCLLNISAANAVVPQRYLNVQYPVNFTIASFTKVINSGRYQGDELAKIYWERGVQYGDLHHYDEAIADYTKALSIRPEYTAAFLNRAVAYARLEKYDLAFADLEQVLKREPGNAAAINTRGKLNFLLGNYEAAVEDFKRHLKLRPDDIYRMLWLYMSEKHADRASRTSLANYVEGVSLDLWPGAFVRLYIGEVPVENFVDSLNKSIGSWDKGSRCEAYFYLGQYYLLNGNKAQALKLFRDAVNTGAISYVEYEFSLAYTLRLKAK